MKKNPHSRLFSLYPLTQLASACLAGVVVSQSITIKLTLPITACAVCSVGALALFARRKLKAAGLTILSAIFFAGLLLAIIEQRITPTDSVKRFLDEGMIDPQRQVLLTGVLDSPPEFARDRLHLRLRVESLVAGGTEGKTSGVVALLATFRTGTSEQEYRQLNLHYGSRLQVKTTLNRSNTYRNPGVSTLTEYLDRKNYDATGVVKSPTAIAVTGEVPVFKPLAWLYAWRESLQRKIDQTFSADTAGILDAAVLGNRYNLSRSTEERFRDAGTFHVLVISGLHISFIGGLVFLIARRLTRRRILQFVISSLIVWGYTVAVGAESSVVRAALMFTFVAFAGVVFRPASALNALGGAALALVIKSPKDLFDPSLQLTFLSVLAIVTIAWPLLQQFKAIGTWRPMRETPYPPSASPVVMAICECLFWSECEWRAELVRMPHQYRLFKSPLALRLERAHLQRPLRYIFSAVVVSMSVQIVLLPLLIIYFHRLSLSSVVLNIVVSLLLALLSAIALLALLISQVSATLAGPLCSLANGVNWIMIHSVDPFARAGLASIRLPEYSQWGAAIYLVYYVPSILILGQLARWHPLGSPVPKGQRRIRRWHIASLAQALLLVVVLFHPLSAGRSDGNLHVDFLDVGQGDAALITMPDGATLLVDGGGRPSFGASSKPGDVDSYQRDGRSVGEMVVSEYLWWRGLDTVDYVLATHADADHIDGINDIVRNFRVRTALVGRTPESDSEYAKFQQTLAATKTNVAVINAGDTLHFGNVTATVLWPDTSDDPNAPSGNNDSVVLKLQYGERSILLTGDIEKEAENQIMTQIGDLHVDIVKVPHHGSRTSSTNSFVGATRPRFAVISVGQTSIFGHPHAEVVERWEKNGAEVLTTGRSGTISVTTNGKELWVKKFVE